MVKISIGSFAFTLILIHATLHSSASEDASIVDVTTSVFGSDSGYKGHVAAFGDLNNDKHADIFVISEDGKNITILLGNTENTLTLTKLQTFSLTLPASSVVPGDYNGDGYMDVLITQKQDDGVQIVVYWGDETGLFSSNYYSDDQLLKDQPLILDANADMILDLLVSYPNNTRGFWLGHHVSANWSFDKHDFKLSPNTTQIYNMRVPHSNAFLDLTGEGSADLFITSVDSEKKCIFEIWQGSRSGLKLFDQASLQVNEVGQSVFSDVNGDANLDHLVPVCEIVNGRCTNSKILMQHDQEWIEVFVAQNGWNFIPRSANHMKQPITLVTGDFNQDIFIDILCIMQQTTDNGEAMISKAVVLYGGICQKPYCEKASCEFLHAFVVPSSDGAFSSAFFDLETDGTMDILVSIATDSSATIRAYHNTVAEDVSFLMVKILPGLQNSTNSNIHGPMVSYVTTNTTGGNQESVACQLSQSAHLALQLPYVTFGLGRLPNFVDSLIVSIPTPLYQFDDLPSEDPTLYPPLRNTWTMIIPNSQLFIVPYPINAPDSWTNRLLVTPSKNVITTAIVLLSICAMVSMAIVALHCMERRDDRKEKIQEAHRFHFDAM